MSNSSEQRDLSLDLIKGIAIILVVYGHVIEHSMAPWSGDAFFENPVFKIIYTFHMPLFVFVSGYLMAHSLKRRSSGEVLQSRVKSLLVPFLTLSILGVMVTYVLDIMAGHKIVFNPAADLANQLFARPVVWFLFTLFALSVVLILSVKLEKRFGVIVFPVIYVLLLTVPYNDYGALYYIKWFYFFYMAGYLLSRYREKIAISSSAMTIVVTSLVMFILLLPRWNMEDYIYINKMHVAFSQLAVLKFVYRYYMGFLGIILAFYTGRFLLKTRLTPYLIYLGVHSLDIYIIQMFILEGIYPRFIQKAQIHLDFTSPLVLYIIAPLLSLAFIGICLLISNGFIRRFAILNKLILGGR